VLSLYANRHFSSTSTKKNRLCGSKILDELGIEGRARGLSGEAEPSLLATALSLGFLRPYPRHVLLGHAADEDRHECVPQPLELERPDEHAKARPLDDETSPDGQRC